MVAVVTSGHFFDGEAVAAGAGVYVGAEEYSPDALMLAKVALARCRGMVSVVNRERPCP